MPEKYKPKQDYKPEPAPAPKAKSEDALAAIEEAETLEEARAEHLREVGIEVGPPKLPPELQAKLAELKEKLERFSKALVEKFERYIMGVALLPPSKPEPGKPAPKPEEQKINVLVLVDDSDVKKMSREELLEKLGAIMAKIGSEVEPRLAPQPLLLSELWQSCFEAKYDWLQLIALSAPVYDTGMLSAIKIAEIHKSMVLKKFERYIVAYVLAGSLVQGKATPESDIDVFIVVDDTDVKRMTRIELKDKLRAIIIGMAIEAGELTGIRNKLNVQVYILTDFWESVKEANPIIFTFLRDGVPFFDRGIFMPWKLLLKQGRIRPSTEAIEMYLSGGEQMLRRIDMKLNDIGMEDLFYATLTPSQAAIMLYGLAPPTPRETPIVMREIFVDKEKLLEPKWIEVLERIIELRKSLEHAEKKKVSGEELDRFIKDSHDYLERLKKLFSEIEKHKQAESVAQIYETALTMVRDALALEGIERVEEARAAELFEHVLITTGKLPEKMARMFKEIIKAKADYSAGKLKKAELEKMRKHSLEFFRTMLEHIQRRRGRALEHARLRIKHGPKFGELFVLESRAFIIPDIDAPEREIQVADITPDGEIRNIRASTSSEFEEALAKAKLPARVFIKEKTFESLKAIFGPDLEILVSY